MLLLPHSCAWIWIYIFFFLTKGINHYSLFSFLLRVISFKLDATLSSSFPLCFCSLSNFELDCRFSLTDWRQALCYSSVSCQVLHYNHTQWNMPSMDAFVDSMLTKPPSTVKDTDFNAQVYTPISKHSFCFIWTPTTLGFIY